MTQVPQYKAAILAQGDIFDAVHAVCHLRLLFLPVHPVSLLL